ncbi:hypothetical protein EJ05DRAFT_207645 [Pseudovirgaria hyperparasitica]|uniref:Uncharacterized protein n=1 Tax=Pseudovirgaria hyperparasitica TaxID=470096 RepID=A0A6A6WK49_9PEZI|nr:uncharacterized protein EJ05DRAFT_207645 [Pseudovirgaria hyperparasitica]KAF2762371.1 hypothetical protein EJ05DRAFT_207645 [Pseudovirgaria hyperparasitica]
MSLLTFTPTDVSVEEHKRPHSDVSFYSNKRRRISLDQYSPIQASITALLPSPADPRKRRYSLFRGGGQSILPSADLVDISNDLAYPSGLVEDIASKSHDQFPTRSSITTVRSVLPLQSVDISRYDLVEIGLAASIRSRITDHCLHRIRQESIDHDLVEQFDHVESEDKYSSELVDLNEKRQSTQVSLLVKLPISRPKSLIIKLPIPRPKSLVIKLLVSMEKYQEFKRDNTKSNLQPSDTSSESIHMATIWTTQKSSPGIPCKVQRRKRDRLIFKLAPNINAHLPPDVDISSQEILAFFPNHVQWPSICCRLISNGYTASDLSSMLNWHRNDGCLTRQCASSILRKPTCGRRHENTSAAARHVHKSNKDISTTRLTPPRDVPPASRTFPLLASLAQGVTHWPLGIEARTLTWAIKFSVANPDLCLTVKDVKWIVGGHFLRYRGNMEARIRPLGPQNVDKVTLTEWRHRGGRLTENEGGRHLSSGYTLKPGNICQLAQHRKITNDFAPD